MTLSRHLLTEGQRMQALTRQVSPDPAEQYPDPDYFAPPPGEKPDDEVTGAALAALTAVMDRYFATIDEDLKAASAPATLQFHQVKDIRVNRVGRWVLITVKFKAKKGQPNEFTFRIGRPWAGVLYDRLARVLGE